jgi:hypothetical protein
MATIFRAPESITVPSFSTFYKDGKYDREAHDNAEKQYLADLKAMLVKRNNGKNVGEVVQFPHADSYAEYMVANMRPLELVHLPLGDAWDYPYIERLNASDIQGKIDQKKALEKIFKKM